LDDCIEDCGQVGHDLSTPVLRNLINKLLTEPKRSARIRGRYYPSLRSPQSRIPAIGPTVVPNALRTAMDKEHGRIFFRSIEIRRLRQPILRGRSSSTSHGQALVLWRCDLVQPCGVFVGQLLYIATFCATLCRNTIELRRR